MSSTRLTPLQRETLGLIARGRVEMVKFGHGAWRICGASPTAVGRVISLGLAAWSAHDGSNRLQCSLTEAGRAEQPDEEVSP